MTKIKPKKETNQVQLQLEISQIMMICQNLIYLIQNQLKKYSFRHKKTNKIA